MKKYLIDNKGSTLMLVLFITIIFSVLFLSFTTISMNAKKQNEQVEDSSQAYALAEMGVEYYNVGVVNIVENYKKGKAKDKIEEINDFLNSPNSNDNSEKGNNGKGNNGNINNDDLDNEARLIKINEMIDELMVELVDDINSFIIVNSTGNLSNNHQFKIQSNDIKPIKIDADTWEWNFPIEGKLSSTNKTKIIHVKYTLSKSDLIKFPTVDEENQNDPNDNDSTPTMPAQVYAQKDSATNVNGGSFDTSGNFIVQNAFDYINAINISATGNVTLGNINNMNTSSSLDIVSNGKVTFTDPLKGYNANIHAESGQFKNIEPLYKSNINIHGNLVTEVIKTLTNSDIYVKGNAEMANIDSLLNSHINIHGNAVTQNVKHLTNSDINIIGNASMEHIEHLNNSAMNIFGNAALESIDNIFNSSVYIHGDLAVTTKISLNNADSIVYVGGKLNVVQSNSLIENGKLCIKQLDNLSQLKDKHIKGRGGGTIIFYDPTLESNEKKMIKKEDYPQIDNSDLTGIHNYVMGIDAFNNACKINPSISNLDEYELNLDKADLLSEVNY